MIRENSQLYYLKKLLRIKQSELKKVDYTAVKVTEVRIKGLRKV